MTANISMRRDTSIPERRLIVSRVALLTLLSFAALAGAQDAATKKMIVELGLVEAPKPIRESPAWRKPERVLAFRTPVALRTALQAAAPGVDILWADTGEEYVALAPRADAALGPCQPAMVSAATRLRWLQTLTAGVERCVTQQRIRDGVVVLTNMQRIGAPLMADHVMAMLLAFSRNLPAYHDARRESRWLDDNLGTAFGLGGKTLFIAGLGGTGLEVARRADAFGMRVIGTRNTKREAPDYVDYVGLPDEMLRLIARADVVVNALPLTSATRDLFDARTFAAMKDGAWFFNVGRGRTVVTADLVQALRSGKIAGAGLDVVDPEPLPADHPLWKIPNVIITPHVASETAEYEDSRWRLARENLRRYVSGERLLSVVDPKRGY